MKKALITFGILGGLIAAGAGAYFAGLLPRSLFEDKAVPFAAIPASTAAIASFNYPTLQGELSSVAYYQALRKVPAVNAFLEGADIIQQIFTKDTAAGFLKNKQIIASLHQINAAENDVLFIIDTRDESLFNLKDILKTFKTNEARIEKHIFKALPIYEIKYKDTNLTFTCTYTRGLFLGSRTAFLVEEAVSQLGSDSSLLTNKNFKKALTLAENKADIQLFLFHKNIASQ